MSILLSQRGIAPFRRAAGRSDREATRLHRLAYLDIPRGYDDRLLRDIGLERGDILGEQRLFWEVWLGVKAPWRL